MAQILFLGLEPVPKTAIMYRANLSFAQLKRYLNFMVGLKLLEEITDEQTDRTFYKTTDKGMDYLESYNKIRFLLGKEAVSNAPLFKNTRKEVDRYEG